MKGGMMKVGFVAIVLAGCTPSQPKIDQADVWKAIKAGGDCVREGNVYRACADVCMDLFQVDDERMAKICDDSARATASSPFCTWEDRNTKSEACFPRNWPQ